MVNPSKMLAGSLARARDYAALTQKQLSKEPESINVISAKLNVETLILPCPHCSGLQMEWICS